MNDQNCIQEHTNNPVEDELLTQEEKDLFSKIEKSETRYIVDIGEELFLHTCILKSSSELKYFQNGQLSRLIGPAVIGDKVEYWFNGSCYGDSEKFTDASWFKFILNQLNGR